MKTFLFLILILFCRQLYAQEFSYFYSYINDDAYSKIENKKNKKEVIKDLDQKKSWKEVKKIKDKLNINYSAENLIFKIKLKKERKNNFIFLDALSPGFLKLFDSNLKEVDSYGFGEKNKDYYPVFNIKEKGEIFYIVRKSNHRFDGNLKLIDKAVVDSYVEFNNNIIFIFLGAMIFLILYQLFYFLISKNVNFLLYVLFNTFYSTVILIFGLWFYKLSNSMIIEEFLIDFAAITIVFSSIFARNFLELKKFLSPKYYKGFLYFEIILVFMVLLHICTMGTFKSIIAPLIDVYIAVNIFYIVYHTFKIRKQNILASFYLMAWLASFSGVFFLYAYEYFNIFEGYKIIRYSLMIGCSIEMIINSFGLAYKNKLNEIEKTKALLEAREKKRYQSLVRILSHDISNPLSSASMTLEHFELFPDGKERIGRSLKRITQIIEEVRNEEKETSTANNLVPIQDAYESLKDMFEPRLTEKNIQFKLQAKNNFKIPMRENILVNNLLGNLLSNAIKFSYKNSDIILKVYEEDDNIILSMRDYGKGIKKEILEKLNNGEIVTSEGTDNEKGTGFGTDIVRNLLKNYEAKMEIKTVYHEDESVKDHGSEFMVTIPKIS